MDFVLEGSLFLKSTCFLYARERDWDGVHAYRIRRRHRLERNMVQPRKKGNRPIHGPESIMMSISFPAGEHLLPHRLEAVVWERGHSQVGSISLKEENKGIPLDEQAKPIPEPQKESFCLGPDVSIPL